MTTQNYLMINKSTNIVDNICLWDGDTNTWHPPSDMLMLVQADTISLTWKEVETNGKITDWVLGETIGVGDIGFTWDGTLLTTTAPKPKILIQPATTGTQTI